MYKVATEEEINSLVQKTVDVYRKEVLNRLSEYQSNQKIPQNKIIEILNDVYDSEIDLYFFKVEDEE